MLFTSESVASGHPDKVADQISDAVLDAYLRKDPLARVDCEALVSSDLIVLSGQISSSATVDYESIIKKTMHTIGYETDHTRFLINITQQSPEIAQAVDAKGAGDQGIMFGYACDETLEYMPLPIMLAHSLVEALRSARISGRLPFLRPDGKSQVTVEYGSDLRPIRIDTVLLSAHHSVDIELEELRSHLLPLIQKTLPAHLLDAATRYIINPAGLFCIGGLTSDSGITGRKIMVDTYGSMARHGGGAFSGKDPTKVDRSASYMARYIAKNIVAAKCARRCEVQLAYAIGMAEPIAISLETFGTSRYTTHDLTQKIINKYDLTATGIISHLNLRRPIYLQTAYGGHFGRERSDFTWENIDNQ
ncbi:MAG: methionine adenosyltransferase [Verrucomicrobia bacterium]|nr:methionine adenosyltransferase [Verrucomicrobiota bacterium]